MEWSLILKVFFFLICKSKFIQTKNFQDPLCPLARRSPRMAKRSFTSTAITRRDRIGSCSALLPMGKSCVCSTVWKIQTKLIDSARSTWTHQPLWQSMVVSWRTPETTKPKSSTLGQTRRFTETLSKECQPISSSGKARATIRFTPRRCTFMRTLDGTHSTIGSIDIRAPSQWWQRPVSPVRHCSSFISNSSDLITVEILGSEFIHSPATPTRSRRCLIRVLERHWHLCVRTEASLVCIDILIYSLVRKPSQFAWTSVFFHSLLFSLISCGRSLRSLAIVETIKMNFFVESSY